MNDKYLIFSDLDGTLLDHDNYSWQAAAATLAALEAANIPVIFNTSKTFVELEKLQQEFSLNTPFIVENGAAIYIPIGYFAEQPADTVVKGGYWLKTFCQPRAYWLALLDEVGQDYQQYYIGFSQLSVDDLVTLSGLKPEQAKDALQRDFSEPLHWQASTTIRDEFADLMSEYGANVLLGGRFLHISGACDKGQAQFWLAEQYREQFLQSDFTTIALGDSDNDVAMLEAADIAVQIRSPKHDFPVLERQFKVIQSEAYGPAGWAEAITHLLPFIFRNEVQHG